MKRSTVILSLLVALALPLNAGASSRTLTWAALEEDSLVGQVHSTAQLQQAFRNDNVLMARAGGQIGLSPSDYETVRAAIEHGRARYVTLPRHIDAMAGMHNGRTFVDRDIIIPDGVHGWEVDIPKDDGTLRVFLPNTCGNISYTFERYRVAAATYTVPQVAAARTPPPIFTPAPFVPIPPEAIATAVPVAVSPPIVEAAHSSPHLAWLAALVVPLILGLSGHGSPGIVATPTPIHTICPTVVVRPR